MVDPSTGGAEPQQNASGAVESAFTFEAFEQLPPGKSTRGERKRLRDRNSLGDDLVEITEAPKPKENNGRVTTQDLRRLIEDLKEVVTHQNNEIREIKADQQILKAQNVELQEQVQSLREQLEATPTTETPAKTWAQVATAGTHPTPFNPLPSKKKKQSKELNCVRVSTKPSETDGENEDENTFRRYLPPRSAVAHIQNALATTPATKDTQVLGVGTTRTGYVIRFQDQLQAETARSNTQWLEELGNDTKLARPRFAVVAHRTPTEGFLTPEDEQAFISSLMEENKMELYGFRINRIAWLKPRDKPMGKHGSLAIWFDTREAAEWIRDNGLLVGQRCIGVMPYHFKERRCYRCQGFGHLAWACREKARCGHCAGEHELRHCPPGARARCLDCAGDHPTNDRSCPNSAKPTNSQ